MGAISFGIINERSGATVATSEGDPALRELAAERLAEEMGRAAAAYERVAERLGLVLESAKTRRRAAWSCGSRQREQSPKG